MPETIAFYGAGLLGSAFVQALCRRGVIDMFAIATANGLSRNEAYALFQSYDPSAQITGRGKRMAVSDYEPTWTLKTAHKDADLMIASAGELPLYVISVSNADCTWQWSAV